VLAIPRWEYQEHGKWRGKYSGWANGLAFLQSLKIVVIQIIQNIGGNNFRNLFCLPAGGICNPRSHRRKYLLPCVDNLKKRVSQHPLFLT
jgi:hypothetical protein